MAIWPVIVRELRAQSRQLLTYWLRIAGGISVVAALATALWTLGAFALDKRNVTAFQDTVQTFGTTLFGKMNLFIFVAIWVFVPLATADAFSRERREGTLPLLYLTELRSIGIVLGKSFVHVLRSASLFVAMAPWLLLPLVFGGVSLQEIRLALMLNGASLLLAQAAGLVASTFPRDWLRSVLLAQAISLVLLLSMLHAHGWIISKAAQAGTPKGMGPGTPTFWNSRFSPLWQFYDPGMRQSGRIARTASLIEITTNGSVHERWYRGVGPASVETNWGLLLTYLTPAGRTWWLRGVTGMLAACGLILVLATWLGAWRLEQSWRDEPSPLAASRFRQQFLVPRFRVQLLKRNLSRSLDLNPIGWLQHYSPSGRLVKWAWCFFIIMIEIVFSADPDDLYAAQSGLGLLLLLGLTFSATGSFRKELETGAFELLLVTPLRERQVIAGRVRGLWRQFLPAILVYGCGSIYLASGWTDRDIASEAWTGLARTITGFCTLPLIGLWFSVQRWNFFMAWIAACLTGMLPGVVARAFGARESTIIPFQIGVAMAAALLLHAKLRNRKFLQRQGQ